MGKTPLRLDWTKLLAERDTSEPPEVMIVDGGPASELTDHQIQEKLRRLRATLGSDVVSKLHDKGEKLQSNVKQLEDELTRRELARVHKQDVGESDRTRQSKTAESSAPFNDSSPNYSASGSRSQSSFASLFAQKLKHRADSASTGEWRSISRDKSEKSWRKGRQQERRQPTRSSQPINSRISPFRCANSLASKKGSSDNGCSVIESPSSPAGHTSFTCSSKRRRASESGHAMDTKSKIQDVVLLDEEEAQSRQPVRGDTPDNWKEVKIYYPSRDDPEATELSYSDIKCLDPEGYLSSPIMNFYIQYLQRPFPPIGRAKGEYYFFNTYFYRKLEEAVSCKGDKHARFLKLRRWWKSVNIFQKAYIFLPIHGDMHWSLVIICIPAKEDESGPIVLHLDSLGMHASSTILDVVECYLKEEWNCINQNARPPDLPISERVWSNLPRSIEKKRIMVPQQKNEYDCGLFVLYFMERFIDEAPERLRRQDLAMFGSKWFHPEEASSLRKRIRDLLVEEFESARLECSRSQKSSTSSESSPEKIDVEECTKP